MADKPNILVIDDELGPRESLKMILKPYYNVYTAERGGQAVEILSQIPIDLVTVDLRMPGLSGIKVLEKVKSHDTDIEAIIITGYGSMDTAIEGLRLGAFDYISKPFDVEHVLDLIRRALERRRARINLRKLKSEFLANVSHELRTPLSVVVGFVTLLLDQLIGKLTDEQLRVLEKIYKNSEELLEMIDNALYLTSLTSGNLARSEEEFDIGVMIRETVARYEKALEQKKIQIAIHCPPQGIHIHSDHSKVARIFQNLLHNAIKFTPEGQITIRAHGSLNRGTVDLEVADTGVGIPLEQIENLFQPFRRVDASPWREFSGLGLGLTVARRLTDFLGGTLDLKSQPGVGTQVQLSLPYRTASRRSDAAESRV
ncbi:MAG: response regulator [Deltaproteobacteria bacterium]|nr:response regulator [Deltaproteobacteria bacterium]